MFSILEASAPLADPQPPLHLNSSNFNFPSCPESKNVSPLVWVSLVKKDIVHIMSAYLNYILFFVDS